MSTEYTLVDLIICAAANTWKDQGEVLATGIGVVPRIAASVCMLSVNKDLMMTDSEAFMVSDPIPIGPRQEGFRPKFESWMGFSRIFDNVWGGKRHALVGPTQIDKYGQSNISAIGGTYDKPKVQMLGVRGFPGNSICHANSFFVPNHNTRVFMDGECDVVCSVGYNPARLPKGYDLDEVKIGFVYTNLCVMDFGGNNHQMRLLSLHPGVSVDQVKENTAFEIEIPNNVPTTPEPTEAQMMLIKEIDPHNLRASVIR
jgi:glutaconate CoA-transferase subunit B